MSIYVLKVWNIEEEEGFDMYFTTLEKAQNFIVNNFDYDKVRKLTSEHYEGKTNQYVIECTAVDQERF